MGWLVGINILRLFAIILVVVYHLFRNILPGGFIAVEIFFCISGFLLASKLLKNYDQQKQINCKSFIARRFSRLFLPLLICVCFTLILTLFVDKTILHDIQIQAVSALTFTTNIFELITGGNYENIISPNPFEHTWFLALEMQFCLILPLIAKVVLTAFSGRRGKRLLGIIFGFLAFFSIILMAIHGGLFEQHSRAYFAIDTHMFAFCLGAAYAVFNNLVPRTPRTLKGIPAILLLASLSAVTLFAFRTSYDNPMTYYFVLPFTAVATVIMLASIVKLQANVGCQRKPVLIIRMLERLGSISFGIYLFHWPLLVLLGHIIGKNMPYEVIAILNIAISIVLSIILAKIMNLDRISLAMKRGRKRGYVPAIGLVVLLLIPSVYAMIVAPKQSAIMDQIASEKTPEQKNEYDVDFTGSKTFTDISEREIGSLFKADIDGEEEAAIYTRPDSPNMAKVFIIGDSVTLGAKTRLESVIDGAYVDAEESRGIEKAAPILADCAARGEMPENVVVSLITNERTITDDLLDGIRNILGDNTKLFLVTGYAGTEQPREVQNAAIKSYASARDNVYVIDWWNLSHDNWSLLYADHIHLNPDGQYAYANLINNEIKRAAE